MDGTKEPDADLTLQTFAALLRRLRFELFDETLFLDSDKLQKLAEELLDAEVRIPELGLGAPEGEQMDLTERIALAEAQSVSSAISGFELVLYRMDGEHYRSKRSEAELRALQHEAKVLANAMGRFIVLAGL